MSETKKHTPGPWLVETRPDTDGAGRPVVAVADGGLVCAVSRRGADRHESEANAHLIAAAPALLSALRELVDAWESADEEPSCVTRARAALALAEPSK